MATVTTVTGLRSEGSLCQWVAGSGWFSLEGETEADLKQSQAYGGNEKLE